MRMTYFEVFCQVVKPVHHLADDQLLKSPAVPDLPLSYCEAGWIRTIDQLLKRQLLYR